ncbi:metallophosphoesterase family protein [Rubinisphaera italica]|uniref:Phosphodiesterase n=1 Tax=Rubinisphaera italica TaxID=2527969 RepID=A0A5C5XJZ2_9PLAN|nr:metallophosphoesterase family protein [Rubinisphaera italica]TWT62445.1 phosphodiesterase [Rubinisphaera italica]HBN79539.1 phosphoesterase [Planctomycetaceae bacterium]
MFAIISDIHGNLEALQAVLADIASKDISKLYCLGDIIGYGPNPGECIDLVMEKAQVTILGNHDQAAMFDPEGFNAGAERAIFWTRKQLEIGDQSKNERRWEFLGELPRLRREEKYMFVHGSARNPLNEYVFPEDIYHQRKMERIFSLVERHCFQGHTHIPGVFTDDLNFLAPEEIDFRYELGEHKALINVGSVGQPRNGDSRSSYVIVDEGTIHFQRVVYDYKKTAEKIYQIPELDNFLGDRLGEGR